MGGEGWTPPPPFWAVVFGLRRLWYWVTVRRGEGRREGRKGEDVKRSEGGRA